MAWKQANYNEVKNTIRPGDVIAFGGRGGTADLIKAATQSPVSHVAIVVQSSPSAGDEPSRQRSPQIIESRGKSDRYFGVGLHWLDERIADFTGNMWWLPLSDAVRIKMDLGRFSAFLHGRAGRLPDVIQAIQASTDGLDHIPLLGELTRSREDFTTLFCSELAAAGLEAGGAIQSLNSSEVTPIDLCRFALYRGTYYQIKGSRVLLPGYNTVNPERWGE